MAWRLMPYLLSACLPPRGLPIHDLEQPIALELEVT
jgi:hypothetical protein